MLGGFVCLLVHHAAHRHRHRQSKGGGLVWARRPILIPRMIWVPLVFWAVRAAGKEEAREGGRKGNCVCSSLSFEPLRFPPSPFALSRFPLFPSSLPSSYPTREHRPCRRTLSLFLSLPSPILLVQLLLIIFDWQSIV